MGARGPKPKGKIKIKWSRHFAYAIGLLVSDGNLSPNGRHITLVSADKEMLLNFMKALDIKVTIGDTFSSYKKKRAFRVQFGDVLFYQFLLSIGLMPNKSKVIGKVKIPSQYFFDFLRGIFDGDGCTYSYWDPRWKSSFMFYLCFASASPIFLNWLRMQIEQRLSVRGQVTGLQHGSCGQLKDAKADSLKILKRMYRHAAKGCYLSRKHLKIRRMLAIVGEQL